MKLPYLKCWNSNTCYVEVVNGINENGAPNVVATYNGSCNLSEDAKTKRTSDGQYVELNATIMISGDIAPDVPAITGYVYLPNNTGKQRRILHGKRVRNPDGTVNHTVLELI